MEHEELKKGVVEFVTGWVDRVALKGYQEPDRKGVPRGEKVGLSAKKRRAAYLMVLHPKAASLKDLSEITGTSAGVLKVWRTEEQFQRAMREAAEELSRWIFRRLDSHSVRLYRGGVGETEKQEIEEETRSLCLSLQLLDPDVFLAVWKRLDEPVSRRDDEDSWEVEARKSSYWLYKAEIAKGRHFTTGGTPAEWVKKNLDVHRAIVNSMVDSISRPEVWLNEETRASAQKQADALKDHVSHLLDVLTGSGEG